MIFAEAEVITVVAAAAAVLQDPAVADLSATSADGRVTLLGTASMGSQAAAVLVATMTTAAEEGVGHRIAVDAGRGRRREARVIGVDVAGCDGETWARHVVCCSVVIRTTF